MIVAHQPSSPEEFIQIVEEKVKLGLLPAVRADKRCFYRTGEKACLIGLCITDEQYYKHKGFQRNLSVHLLKDEDKQCLPAWISLHKAEQLQQLHDKQFSPGLISVSEFLEGIKAILLGDK